MQIKKYSCLLAIIPVVAVFLQVISFDFLKYDDTINVSENAFVLVPSADHLLYFWKAPFLDLYIPLTYTVWTGLAVISLNIFNGRLDPGLFHLLNLVIHALNSMLIFLIIRKLYASREGYGSGNNIIYAAAFGALVFGIHPVQVETVAWITGLKGVLSGFFSLGAIYLYLVYRSAGRNFLIYVASTGLLIMAVLSMPSAVAVPVMLFFIMLWADQRLTGRVVYSLIPWMAIALAAVLVTRTAQPVAAGPETYPWLIRPVVALDAMMFYLHKIIWPDILAIDYCRTPAYVVSLSWRNPYWLMILPAAGLVYWLRNWKPWLALGAAFLAGIMPVSGLLPFVYQETSTVADRYLYLSMAAVAVMAAAIIIERQRSLVISLCILLLIILGTRSFYQCRAWHDDAAIMQHTLRHYPDSFRANLNYGIALASREDFVQAISYYQRARRLKPDSPLPYYHLGLVYAGQGDNRLYEREYEKVSSMNKAMAAKLKRAAEVFEKLNPTDAGLLP